MPVVMDADRVAKSLTRIAHEIIEHNQGIEDIRLVGIRTRGVPIATTAVAVPIASARQSHAIGAPSAPHQPTVSAMPSTRGIWLPMMISPTPVR